MEVCGNQAVPFSAFSAVAPAGKRTGQGLAALRDFDPVLVRIGS
jgi:hypothetical protein